MPVINKATILAVSSGNSEFVIFSKKIRRGGTKEAGEAREKGVDASARYWESYQTCDELGQSLSQG